MPKPKKVRVDMRFDPDLLEDVDRMAREKDMTRTEFFEEAARVLITKLQKVRH